MKLHIKLHTTGVMLIGLWLLAPLLLLYTNVHTHTHTHIHTCTHICTTYDRPALHLSYKELAAAFGRVRPPWELRGPHPSVQYPNLCLLSRKAVSCPNTNGQTFRYTQGKSNKAETMHAAAELMPLPVLSPVRFNNGGATSGSQLELTSSSIVVKGDSKLGGRPHLTHLPCCICR